MSKEINLEKLLKALENNHDPFSLEELCKYKKAMKIIELKDQS